jgi:putative flippase GtrA
MTQVSAYHPEPLVPPAGGRPPLIRSARVIQLVRFGAVGVASTVAYALLYLLLRPVMDAFLANALALLLTAVANTAANRRLTFGVQGRSGVLGDHAVGLLAFGIGLALTTGSLAALKTFTEAGHGVELVVLTAANLMATLLRFGALQLRIGSRSGRLGRLGRSDRSDQQAGQQPAQVVDWSAA